ncbi:MAG: PAS domain S-box protein, partial [Alphaproteobacteria bacterium]|nr:PAS domain S-box protein [Alphaproteobacteria bacterium]
MTRLDQAVGELVGSEAYREIFANWYGTPAPFWDVRKVLIAMAAVTVLAIIAIVAWRYRTMTVLNKQLSATISDRTRAQGALRESEKRFRDFTEAASDWFWETGPDLRFSYVSPRLTDVTGMHPEEYIGKLRTEMPGNLVENTDWQLHVRDLEARQAFRDFTYARRMSDGRIRHFKTSGIPVFDDDGQFHGYRGIGSDITTEIEREQGEQAAENRLARAIETVPAAFALFDADDRLVMCNQTQHDIYGTELVSITPGTRFQDTGHAIAKSGKIGKTPEEGQAWLARRLDRRNHPARGYIFKHDDDRWASVTDHFLPDGSSITLGVDVTDLKRSEEAVREQQERLRSILETAPDAIITIDDHGLISSFSPYAESMFGFSADEVIGQNVKILMPPPFHEEHDGYLAHFRETGEKKIIGIGREVVAQRKDGTTFPMHLAVNEMSIEGQQMFTGVIRDITVEKTRDEQLRQAQKMEAVGQLTGGVAHDFNNLLTAIIGNLEMLEAWHCGDERSEKAISQAQEAAGLGAELTGRLLAFARRQPLDPKVISLSDMVLEMSELLARTLGETIEINTVLANPLDKALVDPTQVQNALLNLAINARDAMSKGGQLTIETANVELDDDYARDHADVTAGNYVLLSVSDTGTGMSPDIRDRVFEPFFTTKDVGKGSGLGLSMVYGFIRQSGGHVRLYSEVGQGTAISLYFPKVEHADSATEEPRTATDIPLARRETVLVVEDDPRVRQVTIQRLQTLGYSVLEAENGHAALDVLKEAPAVNLVFTDVVMPGGMSGSDLAEKVHRLYPGIKVLLTSGYSEHAGIENGAAA